MKPSTTTGKICAVWYFHVIHGRPDFPTAWVRYKLLLKSLTKRLPSVQKLPYNVDLLSWAHEHFEMKAPHSMTIDETWAGMRLSFFFLLLLRGSEMKQTMQKDVEISVDGGHRRITIFIYRSKTDQSNKGCFRTLVATGESICPVRSILTYLNAIGWDCDSEGGFFPEEEVEKRARSVAKRSASSNGMESNRFIAHSLRSGGPTALYVRGISLGQIRRFGRWESDTFRRYLYRDNQVFRLIGSAMVKATGLLGQFQTTQPPDKQVTIEQTVGDSEEERFRVGGKKGKEII